jgi:predicted Fe-Mo cluster-binding NifX family protein
MTTNSIRFAFAVNQSNAFESRNFCNADKFSIYELISNDFVYQEEIINPYSTEEQQAEGSVDNGNEIINLLKKYDINVLVSSIYGRNIQMVNSHFIPVVVSSETPAEVITTIRKHIKWIDDELKNRPAEFKLFTIKKGILKTSIKERRSF